MKITRFLFVLLLLLTGSAALSAQIRFRIQSSFGEPLPYCYVFINQNLWGTTDSSGEAVVPSSQLQLGDSVSFHYIGNNDTLLVWSGKPVDTLSLRPLELGEVVVTASLQDLRLRQAVKPVQPLNWFEEFAGHVEMACFHQGTLAESYSGDFMKVFIPWGGPKNNPGLKLFHEPWNILKLTPQKNIGALRPCFDEIVWQSVLLAQFSPQAQMNRKISIRNNGMLDTMSVYTVTRAYAKDWPNYQLRIYVDTQSRILRRIVYDGIFDETTLLEMTVEYGLSAGQMRNYPRHIRAVFRNTVTREPLFTCDISNTTLSGANRISYQEHRERMLKSKTE